MPNRLLAIDVGSVTGYAYGQLGEDPSHGTMRLPTSSVRDLLGARLDRFEAQLTELFRTECISRVVMAERFHVRNTGEAAVSFGLDGIVRMVAYRHNAPVLVQPEGTVRKEMLGRGSGPSDMLKYLALQWCEANKWPVTTHHEADALVLWHWTERELARQSSGQEITIAKRRRTITTISSDQNGVSQGLVVRASRRRTPPPAAPRAAADTPG